MSETIIAGDIEHYTAENIVEYLNWFKDEDISLTISDSYGGSFTAGMSIYGALKLHKNKVTTKVVGLAASVSSVIFLGGDKDKRFMAEGSFLMIHNPGSGLLGNAQELREEADHLDKLTESVLDIYEKNSNLSREVIAEMMKNETYISAQEAVDMGFASAVIDGTVQMKAKKLDSYKEMISKKSINPKQTKKESTMKDLDKEEKTFLSGLMSKLGITMKGEPKKEETAEPVVIELTMESVGALIDEKIQSSNEAIMTSMKELNESVSKLVNPEEEPEAEPDDKGEDKTSMKAEDILSAVEELEGENLTPASRKKAVTLMKAGKYNKEEFLESAERIKQKIDIEKEGGDNVDHLEVYRSMKGGKRSTYYRNHSKEIDKALSEEA